MRFVLYNIRYATGGRKRLPWGGYLSRTHRNLAELTAFLKSLDPDFIGLVEVDAGSYRARKQNQAETIAQQLGHYHSYRSKYLEGHILNRIPVFNRQGNAFISRDGVRQEKFHYFSNGVKRLVIELETERLTIFLVHLALSFRTRHHQLADLYEFVKKTDKPHIVAGDFNPFFGHREIDLFLGATGLANADPDHHLTFPSWKPKRSLDFILHSPDIRITNFRVPRVLYSDHLPLVCDFELDA